ncbi:MAG: phage holin family protein [Patescibacteria group bacterium]|jgi:putative membrane protein
MYFLLRWIINTLALLIAAYLVPGVSFSGFWSALIAALIFGLINAVIRPIMIILTLPVNLVTLGLFTLVINALMFWLASAVVKGFTVTGFWPAFFGALVYWIIIILVNLIEKAD